MPLNPLFTNSALEALKVIANIDFTDEMLDNIPTDFSWGDSLAAVSPADRAGAMRPLSSAVLSSDAINDSRGAAQQAEAFWERINTVFQGALSQLKSAYTANEWTALAEDLATRDKLEDQFDLIEATLRLQCFHYPMVRDLVSDASCDERQTIRKSLFAEVLRDALAYLSSSQFAYFAVDVGSSIGYTMLQPRIQAISDLIKAFELAECADAAAFINTLPDDSRQATATAAQLVKAIPDILSSLGVEVAATPVAPVPPVAPLHPIQAPIIAEPAPAYVAQGARYAISADYSQFTNLQTGVAYTIDQANMGTALKWFVLNASGRQNAKKGEACLKGIKELIRTDLPDQPVPSHSQLSWYFRITIDGKKPSHPGYKLLIKRTSDRPPLYWIALD